ncbi:HEAT repeat domain-containing protein [Litoribacter populi]|uniref:HEAT repeat domain-containing protein n=1 Tax=Litoribacter populi TaxID=2598460 RepID=UPI00117C1CC6|nr:HEAT repeat domain-containing protein [Litoribacter populi]
MAYKVEIAAIAVCVLVCGNLQLSFSQGLDPHHIDSQVYIESGNPVSGLSYKVQLASYSDPVPHEHFELESQNDGFIWTFGEFEDFREALEVRDSLLADHPDAWVSYYFDGEKATYQKVDSLVQSHLIQSQKDELKESLYWLESAGYLPDVRYKVQVGSHNKPINKEGFSTETFEGNHLLLYGEFVDYHEALVARDSLINVGFKDSWVSFYLSGSRASLAEVSQHIKSNFVQTEVPEVKVVEKTDRSIRQEMETMLYADADKSFVKKLLYFEGERKIYSIALYFIIIFFGTTISLIMVLISHRRSVEMAKARKKVYQRKIDDFLSSLLLEDDLNDELLDKKLQKFKTKIPFEKDWCKELLIKNIVDLKKNFKGEMADMFITIYLKLELLSYTEKLINDSSWYVKTKGIFHFQELGYTKGLPIIKKYTKDPNDFLRNVAIIAYISLEPTEPLSIFNDYKGQIDKIDELKILDTIKKSRIKVPKNIINWLNSKNESLVSMTLKMVTYFNHLEAGDSVISLLDHPSSKIKNEAIVACGKLYLSQAEERLLEIFNKENENNQIEILKTLRTIGSITSTFFLEQLLDEKNSREVKIETMITLKELGSEVYEREFEDNSELGLIKMHVENPFIQ